MSTDEPDDRPSEVDAEGYDWSGGAPTITVGSSDVAKILGLSPYADSTYHDAWVGLVGLKPRYNDNRDGSQGRGHLIEPALLLDWEARHQKPLDRSLSIHTNGLVNAPVHIRDGWKHARPDGLVKSERLGVEAKTTRLFHAEDIIRNDDGTERRFLAWGEDGSSQIPMGYKIQVIWQMHVLDIDKVYVPAFATLSDERREYVLWRDEAAENAVVQKVEAWMKAYVWTKTLTPPPPLNYVVVHAMHKGGGQVKEWVPATAEARSLVHEYRALKEMKARIEKRMDLIKAPICEAIGDAYGMEDLATWGYAKGRESVSLAKLRKVRPDIYKQLDELKLITRGEPTRRFKLADDNSED